MADKKVQINESLKKLTEIVNWLDQDDDIDIAEGLKKVQEGSVLIKGLRIELKEVENSFEQIKKELSEGL